MAEQSNSSPYSRRKIGVLLLIVGVCLLVVQFVIAVLPTIVQRVVEGQVMVEGFGSIGRAIDEEIEPVVAEEVAASQAADAGDTQKLVMAEDTESAVVILPFFAFAPDIHMQLNVLGALRMVGIPVTLMLLGVGLYVLGSRKEPKEHDDPPSALPSV